MVTYEERLPAGAAGLFKADPARWLLKARSPLVRYRTYLDLLGYAQDHPKPAALLPCLREDPDLAAVLGNSVSGGHGTSLDPFFQRAGARADLYGPKYAALVWRLPVFADLGMTARDEAPARAYEALAGRVTDDGFFDLTGKGFALIRANALAYSSFLRMGWPPGEFAPVLRWLAAVQRADGGWADRFEIREPDAPSTIATTAHATAAVGYAASKGGATEFTAGRKRAAEYLSRNLLSGYAGRFQPTNKFWGKLSWPQYDFDVVTAGEALAAVGSSEETCRRVTELIVERQTPRGFWRQRVRFAAPLAVAPVEPGHASRWLTLKAAKTVIALNGGPDAAN